MISQLAKRESANGSIRSTKPFTSFALYLILYRSPAQLLPAPVLQILDVEKNSTAF